MCTFSFSFVFRERTISIPADCSSSSPQRSQLVELTSDKIKLKSFWKRIWFFHEFEHWSGHEIKSHSQIILIQNHWIFSGTILISIRQSDLWGNCFHFVCEKSCCYWWRPENKSQIFPLIVGGIFIDKFLKYFTLNFCLLSFCFHQS